VWLKSFFYTSKSLKSKYAHFLLCNTNRCMYLPVDHLWLTCEINKTLLTRYFMALFITLGLISRPSCFHEKIKHWQTDYTLDFNTNWFSKDKLHIQCLKYLIDASLCIQYSWQHTLINAKHNLHAEPGDFISIICLNC
jgi:hypothetical protein